MTVITGSGYETGALLSQLVRATSGQAGAITMSVGISDSGDAPPITLAGGRSTLGAGGDVTITGGSGDAAVGGSVTIQAGLRGDGTPSAGTAAIKSASGNNAVSVTDNQIDITAGVENSKIVMTVPVPTRWGACTNIWSWLGDSVRFQQYHHRRRYGCS